MKIPFRNLQVWILIFMPWVTFSQADSFTGQLMTVNGPIEPGEMGATLIHEHVMVDWVGADSTGYHRWDRDEIIARARPFLEELNAYGIGSFIDCTPAYLGRDPWVLKRLSDRTGIHILTNTGFYGARDNIYVPALASAATHQEIAAIWIEEFRQGIDGSGIRPGFIKISVENRDTLSALHEKLVRAAALTHLETGLTVVSHTGGDGPAMAQLRVFAEMGVSPEAFVWTHAQNGTMEGYQAAAKMGAWISLDHINAQPAEGPDGPGNIAWYVQTLSDLKAEGVLDHILISHDAGWYDVGEKNGGGYRGYTDLFTHLIPELRSHGFTQDDIDQLIRINPRRAYTLRVRKRE